MLDLDARVHLDEIELAVLVQELDRADAEILQLAHRLGDRLADLVARAGVERRRGAFLPHLLMPALQRAVALAEMDRVALAVAEHLDLDVARLLADIFPDRPRRRRTRPSPRRARSRAPSDSSSSLCATFMPRPPPPAAAFTSTGKPISRPIASASASDVMPPSEPGTTGMPSRLAVRLASILSPIRRMCSARGPMKWTSCSLEDFGEARVLGEEAVARMHRVGAGDLAGGEQRRDVEIAVARRRRADAHALVGEPHMHRVGVGGRMHRDGRDAELLAGAQHPERDLAAIGDQDFVEHRCSACDRTRRHSHSIQ